MSDPSPSCARFDPPHRSTQRIVRSACSIACLVSKQLWRRSLDWTSAAKGMPCHSAKRTSALTSPVIVYAPLNSYQIRSQCMRWKLAGLHDTVGSGCSITWASVPAPDFRSVGNIWQDACVHRDAYQRVQMTQFHTPTRTNSVSTADAGSLPTRHNQ